jgi:hypothetical protein
MTDRTALYRHFNANGDLLYVGISLCAIYRLEQHRMKAPWFPSIAKVDIEWFDTRELARDAEIEAIRSENPRHNINHAVQQPRIAAPMAGTYSAAIEALGLEVVSGYLPAGLAVDVQQLIDKCQADAMALRDASRSVA